MSANLYEQTKEIAVLRATGVKKSRIISLYVYEALILVISSTLLGILIGTLIGYSMTLQQQLFTQIPVTFFFPYTQFLLVVGISLICAFASTYGPTNELLKHEIAYLFRLN